VEVIFDKRRSGRIHGNLNVIITQTAPWKKEVRERIGIGVSIIF